MSGVTVLAGARDCDFAVELRAALRAPAGMRRA